MATLLFRYDYKNGEMVKGQALLDVEKIKILGRNIKQVIGVINREDRTDGLIGGGVEMLIVNHGNNEYGSIEMTVEELEACICPTPLPCSGICLDGCSLVLDRCCLTLN